LQNFPEEKVREEVRRLLEEKDSYQAAAKEALKKVVQEKVEAVVKLKDIERCVFQLLKGWTIIFSETIKIHDIDRNHQMQSFCHNVNVNFYLASFCPNFYS
jgi:hypothetical protein